jgi:hypothetical protein
LLEGCGAKPSSKHRLKKLTGLSIPILAGALVLMLGAGGYFLYGHWMAAQNNQPENFSDINLTLPDSSKVSIEQAAERAQSAAQSREKLLAHAREEEVQWLTEDFATRDPAAVFSAVREAFSRVPMRLAGWRVSGMEYDVATPSTIMVTWTKDSGMATPLTLGNSLTERVSIEFALTGETAHSRHPIEAPPRRSIEDAEQFIRGSEFDEVHLMHELERSGLEWGLSRATPTARPKPIEGIENPDLANRRQLSLEIKEFTAKANSEVDLQAIGRLLGRAQTVLIDRVSARFEDGQQWIIYGELYED